MRKTILTSTFLSTHFPIPHEQAIMRLVTPLTIVKIFKILMLLTHGKENVLARWYVFLHPQTF